MKIFSFNWKAVRSTLFLLFIPIFFIVILQGCGSGSNSSSEGETASQEISPNSRKGSLNVSLGYNQSVEMNKGNLTVPISVLSAKLLIYDMGDLVNPIIPPLILDTPSDGAPFAFSFELEAGLSYYLRAFAYDGNAGSGTEIFSGSYSNLIFLGNEATTVEMSLAKSGTIDPPSVGNIFVDSITSVSAMFHASVSPNGVEAVAFFEWGTTKNLLNNTSPVQSLGDGSVNVPVSQLITGLTVNQIYYLRIVAENGGNRVNSVPIQFSTLGASEVTILFPVLPTIVPGSVIATPGLPGTVILEAIINPEGSATKYYYQWGNDNSYGSTTTIGEFPGDWQDGPVQASLTGLMPGNQYHFRVVAFNGEGLRLGNDTTFISN